MPVEKVLAKLKEDDAPKYYGLSSTGNKSLVKAMKATTII